MILRICQPVIKCIIIQTHHTIYSYSCTNEFVNVCALRDAFQQITSENACVHCCINTHVIVYYIQYKFGSNIDCSCWIFNEQNNCLWMNNITLGCSLFFFSIFASAMFWCGDGADLFSSIRLTDPTTGCTFLRANFFFLPRLRKNE